MELVIYLVIRRDLITWEVDLVQSNPSKPWNWDDLGEKSDILVTKKDEAGDNVAYLRSLRNLRGAPLEDPSFTVSIAIAYSLMVSRCCCVN